jgi:hypothetical protein
MSSTQDKARAKAWYLKNRERHNATAKEWQRRNRDKTKLYGLRFKYGLNTDPRIGDACWICGNTEKLVIDHQHNGKRNFRGVLCGSCNRGIGHFYENPEALRQAATYLEGALEYQRVHQEVA